MSKEIFYNHPIFDIVSFTLKIRNSSTKECTFSFKSVSV